MTIDPQAQALALLGFMIVFLVLLTMATVIWAMGKVDHYWQAKEKRDDVAALTATPTIDTTTLVLISAAVATMVAGRGRIRTIRRLLPSESPSSAWSVQGRQAIQTSHAISRATPNGGKGK